MSGKVILSLGIIGTLGGMFLMLVGIIIFLPLLIVAVPVFVISIITTITGAFMTFRQPLRNLLGLNK